MLTSRSQCYHVFFVVDPGSLALHERLAKVHEISHAVVVSFGGAMHRDHLPGRIEEIR
jgi:hypothetical protein